MSAVVRNIFVGVIVSATAACWVPAAAAQDVPAIRKMRVLVLNRAGVAPKVLAQSEAAAERVFRRAGIETIWCHVGAGETCGGSPTAEVDLRSAIIVNVMSAEMEAGVRVPGEALGYAVPGGRMAGILYRRLERWASVKAVDVPTVLGHVLAHEIGHLLLPPDSHSAGGIMNARLDPIKAAQGCLWFSEAQATGVRATVAVLARTREALIATGKPNGVSEQ